MMDLPIQTSSENASLEQVKSEIFPIVSLLKLCSTFLYMGGTAFGGMWGATQQLESILVDKRGWLTKDELESMYITATLIPGPKFLALAGLIGFRLRKFSGSAIAVLSLILPGTLLVLLGSKLINPAMLAGPLAPLRKMVGIGVIGLLFANSYHQFRNAKVKGRKRIIGGGVGILVAVTSMLGVPLLISAGFGFAAALFLISQDKADDSK
jgi:chromate transporter